jgi:hypothetical protein
MLNDTFKVQEADDHIPSENYKQRINNNNELNVASRLMQL